MCIWLWHLNWFRGWCILISHDKSGSYNGSESMLLLWKGIESRRFEGLGTYPSNCLLVNYQLPITIPKKMFTLLLIWLFLIICFMTFLRLFFLIAEICLLAGSVRNAYHTKYAPFYNNLSCETLRKGVFGAGAAFIFFTAIVSEFYYVSYSHAKENVQPY